MPTPANTTYAQVILPLAVAGCFTYIVSPDMRSQVKVGMRVVVQFGTRRYYTGIVQSVSETLPAAAGDVKKLKSIADVIDSQPTVLPAQLALWQWMAQYYMCSIGEVMKAALPSGLKLESETILLRNDDFCADEATLSPREQDILRVLDTDKGKDTLTIEKELGVKNLMPSVRRLMELGAIIVRETLTQSFRPQTETYVRLAQGYFTQEALHQVLDQLKRAPAQEALMLRYIEQSGAAAALALQNESLLKPLTRRALCPDPSAATALTALRKRGVLETYQQEVSRLAEQSNPSDEEPHFVKPLSEEQQRAHDEIVASFAQKPICLLHGVTSSGKTEVYIHLIREAIARDEQVLYLVPEIALTTQLTTRLERVFGKQMGVYHSKFPDAERVELWRRQLTPEAYPLILGVRSSIFLPFQRIGLIIVDEEHETSYKQVDPAPRYNARDTAMLLAIKQGAKVLLGTATPSLESYYKAQSGKYGLVKMLHRFGNVQLPEIIVEDVKELQRKRQMPTPFSPRLTSAVRQTLEQKGQAILFQNRRGYSPVLECRECGWTPRCSRCDVSLTFHQRIGKLVCHYCGAQYAVPTQCPCCESTKLRDMGYGTEKIESAAQNIFPEAKTERMDLDTTRSRTAYEHIIDRFSCGETNLLIGTQMVTKGLDFDRVQVVGILNADQMLNMPDFRAYERAFQMLSQVAGRAGRRGKRGLVVLQTKQADNPIIAQVVRGDYQAMYDLLIPERRDFHYPPFYRIINIYLKHRNDDVVDHAAQHLAALLRRYFRDDLLGPDRPMVARVQLQYIRKIMLKVNPAYTATSVRQSLLSARDAVLHYPVYKGVNIYFDVD